MKSSHVVCAWILGCAVVMLGIPEGSSAFDRRFSARQQEPDPLPVDPIQWMDLDENEVKPKDNNQMKRPITPQPITIKTTDDKVNALRWKLLGLISEEAKQLSSNNQSIVSIAFLAFGVILFDVLTDAIFGDQSNLVASLVGGQPQSRETMLPGLGLFGDNVNNLAEVVLNMLTIYIYRDESPDCGERLLCESNQQAVSRGFLDSLVTYLSGFSVSFFLRQAPISKNLEAMRAGRKGLDCIELFPRCSISL